MMKGLGTGVRILGIGAVMATASRASARRSADPPVAGVLRVLDIHRPWSREFRPVFHTGRGGRRSVHRR